MRSAGPVAALLLASPALTQPLPARLGPIKAFLFHESTGTLSGNIAPPADFVGWNTIIGEGPARDSARDVLVTVPLSLPQGADMGVDSVAPVTIVAKGRGGRTIASRTVDNIVVPYRGQVLQALWLRDATCEGRIVITASYGRQTRTAVLRLDCGE